MNLFFTNYEPGMVPGPGLSATQTFLYFVVAPIALFLVISAVSYGASSKRPRKKSVVDRID